MVEIILDGKEVTVQDVLRHQRWRPTTRSARHKLAKFVKDHEHLLTLDPTSPEGAAPPSPRPRRRRISKIILPVQRLCSSRCGVAAAAPVQHRPAPWKDV